MKLVKSKFTNCIIAYHISLFLIYLCIEMGNKLLFSSNFCFLRHDDTPPDMTSHHVTWRLTTSHDITSRGMTSHHVAWRVGVGFVANNRKVAGSNPGHAHKRYFNRLCGAGVGFVASNRKVAGSTQVLLCCWSSLIDRRVGKLCPATPGIYFGQPHGSPSRKYE